MSANVDTPHLCFNPPWLQSLQTHSGAILIARLSHLSEFFNSAGGTESYSRPNWPAGSTTLCFRENGFAISKLKLAI